MTEVISTAAAAPTPINFIPFPVELPLEDGLGWTIQSGAFVWSDAPLATLDDIEELKDLKINVPSVPASSSTDYIAADGTYKTIPKEYPPAGPIGSIQCNAGDSFVGTESIVIEDGKVVVNTMNNGIDPVLCLENYSQTKGSGAAIQWKYKKPTGEEYIAGLIGMRDWSVSSNFGEMFIRIGAHNQANTDTVTLDANGYLRSQNIVVDTAITAGKTNPTGFVYFVGPANAVPGQGVLRHGAWARDHYAIVFRGAGVDYGCATWQNRLGLGTTKWNEVQAKLHVINHNDSQPTHIDEGTISQTQDIYQANPHHAPPGTSFSIDCNGIPVIPTFPTADRPANNTDGRVRMIWNSDTGMLNFDNGTNWVLADGTLA